MWDHETILAGVIRFIGPTDFDIGTWVGLELDEPQPGAHDGTLDGRQYFDCPPHRGLFVQEHAIIGGDTPAEATDAAEEARLSASTVDSGAGDLILYDGLSEHRDFHAVADYQRAEFASGATPAAALDSAGEGSAAQVEGAAHATASCSASHLSKASTQLALAASAESKQKFVQFELRVREVTWVLLEEGTKLPFLSASLGHLHSSLAYVPQTTPTNQANEGTRAVASRPQDG